MADWKKQWMQGERYAKEQFISELQKQLASKDKELKTLRWWKENAIKTNLEKDKRIKELEAEVKRVDNCAALDWKKYDHELQKRDKENAALKARIEKARKVWEYQCKHCEEGKKGKCEDNYVACEMLRALRGERK